jgi:hypothetical protein
MAYSSGQVFLSSRCVFKKWPYRTPMVSSCCRKSVAHCVSARRYFLDNNECLIEDTLRRISGEVSVSVR